MYIHVNNSSLSQWLSVRVTYLLRGEGTHVCHVWWRATYGEETPQEDQTEQHDRPVNNQWTQLTLTTTNHKPKWPCLHDKGRVIYHSYNKKATQLHYNSYNSTSNVWSVFSKPILLGAALGNRPILLMCTSSVLRHQMLLHVPIWHKACLAIIHSVCQILP